MLKNNAATKCTIYLRITIYQNKNTTMLVIMVYKKYVILKPIAVSPWPFSESLQHFFSAVLHLFVPPLQAPTLSVLPVSSALSLPSRPGQVLGSLSLVLAWQEWCGPPVPPPFPP